MSRRYAQTPQPTESCVRPLRALVFPLLLGGFSAHGQQPATPGTSGQWQPDVQANEQLLKEAEQVDARPPMPPGGKPPGNGKPDGDGPRGGGGMGGPPPGGMDGGMGGPPAGGGKGGPPRDGGRPAHINLTGLLPYEAAFAAPAEDSLVLQRMRDAMAFGLVGHDDVVIIPFQDKTDLGNGVMASMLETNGAPALRIDMPDGRRATYRYTNPQGANGSLQVDIGISGDRIPGGTARLRRVYRRVNVEVRAPQPAAG